MAAEKTQGRSTVDNDMNMTNAWDGTALETLLNSLKTTKVRHFVETSLTDAIERSTQELGAMVLCPNGIVINGMLVATPDQEINLTTSGNKVRLTVESKNIDITVPYATKAAKDSNGLAFSNYQLGINKLFLVQESDGSTTIKYTTIATNNDGTDESRAVSLGTFMLSTEIIRRLNDISSAQSQGMVFMGTIGADTKITSFNTAVGGEDMTGIAFANISGDVNVKSGWTFRNTVAQDLASNVHVEPGDMIILVNDVPNNRAIVPTDYTIVQNNIDKATNDSLGLVKIGSNIDVDNDGTISVPLMTTERAGVAAVGTNLVMQTGHLCVNKGEGLENSGDGALRVSDPTVRAFQSGGETSIGVKVGNTSEGTATLPHATSNTYGVARGDGNTITTSNGLLSVQAAAGHGIATSSGGIQLNITSGTVTSGSTVNMPILDGSTGDEIASLFFPWAQSTDSELAGGMSQCNFDLDSRKKLLNLNIITGTCATAAATAQKDIVFEDDDTKMAVRNGTILCVKFTNANTANNPTIKTPLTRSASPIIYKGAALTGTGAGEVFIAGYWTTFVMTDDGWVFISNNREFTFNHATYGGGYTTCSTAAATAAKTASLTGYALAAGGIVSVRFTNGVPANATLNINSTGAKPIWWHNAAIVANTIKGGDTATFIYDGSHYMLIANDHDVTAVNVSVSESNKNVTDAATADYDKPVSVASAHYLFSALAQRIQELEDAMTWQ